MKKLIIAGLLSLSMTLITTSSLVRAEPQENASEVKTIVISLDKEGNDSGSRVYQYVNGTMRVTNRTIKIHDKKCITHLYGQTVEINGKEWWKVGENQYFKPERVNVVNVDYMKQLGIPIDNYINYNGKHGVSMIADN